MAVQNIFRFSVMRDVNKTIFSALFIYEGRQVPGTETEFHVK